MISKTEMVGLFLLEKSNAVLEVKVSKTQRDALIETFKEYFQVTEEGKNTIKDYSHLPPYEFDDEEQLEYKLSENDMPYFGQIRTNIFKDTHESVNTKIEFEKVRERDITAWILHIQVYIDGKIKNVLLFQSFYKPNMLVTRSKLDNFISMTFFSEGGFFQVEEQESSLNLKKVMNAVYLDDKMIYVLDRYKANTIFNEDARIQSVVGDIFKTSIIENNEIFEIGDKEDVKEMTSVVEENVRLAKRMYSINRKKVLEGKFNMKKFKQHLDAMGMIGLHNKKTDKLIVSFHQLEDLLDALNNNLFTSWDGSTKYKATSKKIIGSKKAEKK